MKVRFFDACILGQGIGGLVAATMLQRRHAKVLILSDRKTASFNPTDCEFLSGFTIKPILKRAGFHPTEIKTIAPLEAPLQFIAGDRRVDCYGDEKRFARELSREYPENAAQILALFKESAGRLELYQHMFNSRVPLPPRGFFARRKFKKNLEQICDRELLKFKSLRQELQSLKVGEDFARVLESLQPGLSGLTSPWVTGSRLAHLLTLIRWEGYAAPDGLTSIREMLLAKLKEKEAVIVECDEISELILNRRSLKGFRVKGCEWEEINCKITVFAGDPRGLIAMAPEKKEFRDWKKQLDRVPVSAVKVRQIYRLAPEGIPVGMAAQGILIPPAPEGEERRKLIRAVQYVVHPNRTRAGKTETDLALTALIRGDAPRPEADTVSREIRRTVKTVIPFIDESLLEEPKTPFIPSMEGSPGDFRQGFVYGSEEQPLFGIYGNSAETPLKNMFFAGEAVFPGLGLDGEIIAGLYASHLGGDLLATEKTGL